MLLESKLSYRELLATELSQRCERNPRYSLRAFAKALGVDASVLSRVLSGHRALSIATARRVAETLRLPPERKTAFLASIVTEQGNGPDNSRSKKLAKNRREAFELEPEVFRVISDWYHYAILELTFTASFRPDPRWVAKQLGIQVSEARLALDRLLKLGLLERAGGKVRKAKPALTIKDKTTTSTAQRAHQRQILEKAIASLEADPLDRRSMTGMTMAIDPSKIELARRRIQSFMSSLCAELGSGSSRTVYQLGIALYPLQKQGEQR